MAVEATPAPKVLPVEFLTADGKTVLLSFKRRLQIVCKYPSAKNMQQHTLATTLGQIIGILGEFVWLSVSTCSWWWFRLRTVAPDGWDYRPMTKRHV